MKESKAVMVKECIHYISRLKCPFAYYFNSPPQGSTIEDYSHSYFCGLKEYFNLHKKSNSILNFNAPIAHFNMDGVVEDNRLQDGKPMWCPLRWKNILVALALEPTDQP